MRFQLFGPMQLATTLAALLLLSDASTAQNQSARQPANAPPVQVPDSDHNPFDPPPPPQVLKAMVKRAEVIVDGTVQSVFPARLRDVNDPKSVETDVLFAVDRVLEGKPESLRTLVITQMGGKYDGVEVAVEPRPPLKPGDRHILFLNHDRRVILPIHPRTDGQFFIVGGWSRTSSLQRDAIKAVRPDALKKFENESAEDFIALIVAEVSAAQ